MERLTAKLSVCQIDYYKNPNLSLRFAYTESVMCLTWYYAKYNKSPLTKGVNCCYGHDFGQI